MSAQDQAKDWKAPPKRNAINWFEIPVTDFERARKFYGAILDTEIQGMATPDGQIGFLPAGEGAVAGGILKSPQHTPSENGVFVYLNGGDDLNVILGRVEKAGGRVALPKLDVGDYGYIARFRDTEGNLISLHSMG